MPSAIHFTPSIWDCMLSFCWQCSAGGFLFVSAFFKRGPRIVLCDQGMTNGRGRSWPRSAVYSIGSGKHHARSLWIEEVVENLTMASCMLLTRFLNILPVRYVVLKLLWWAKRSVLGVRGDPEVECGIRGACDSFVACVLRMTVDNASLVRLGGGYWWSCMT